MGRFQTARNDAFTIISHSMQINIEYIKSLTDYLIGDQGPGIYATHAWVSFM